MISLMRSGAWQTSVCTASCTLSAVSPKRKILRGFSMACAWGERRRVLRIGRGDHGCKAVACSESGIRVGGMHVQRTRSWSRVRRRGRNDAESCRHGTQPSDRRARIGAVNHLGDEVWVVVEHVEQLRIVPQFSYHLRELAKLPQYTHHNDRRHFRGHEMVVVLGEVKVLQQPC